MTERKSSNPKDALGVKKVPLHCIPCQPLYELGLAMMEGSRKYGTHNYRSIGVRASVYYDAAMRHLMAWWEGEDIDSDSGLYHVIKTVACLIVLRDAMLIGKYEDDRPIKHDKGLNLDELNKAAGVILEKYPECANPFTEKGKAEMEAEMEPEKDCLTCRKNGSLHCPDKDPRPEYKCWEPKS